MEIKNLYVGYSQASQMLGIPRGTLYSLVNRQTIPHFRIGPRNVRFSLSDLENWMARHRIPPKKESAA